MEIEIDGARYHVRDTANGAEPSSGAAVRTVVMLHGWPDDSRLWRTQSDAFAERGYRVIAPDLLGYGRSQRHTDLERYAGARLAADLLALLDRLGVGRFDLVAHDWGAVVGWEMAAAAPERITSYAALSVGHAGALFDLDHGTLSNLWYFLLAQTEVAPDLFRAADGAFMRFMLASHPEGEAIADRMVAEPGYLEAMRRIELAHPVGEILHAALSGALPEPMPVRTRTLGLWGVDEELMWEPQIAGSDRFVEAEWRYERVADAGHWLMLDQPETVTRLLLEWAEAGPSVG